MDNRKIYCYYTLTPLDVLDSVDWARENYHKYEGQVSPLWNEHVQKEFARLNEVHLKNYYEDVEIIYDSDDLIEETN